MDATTRSSNATPSFPDPKTDEKVLITDWKEFWRQAKENAKKIGVLKAAESGEGPVHRPHNNGN